MICRILLLLILTSCVSANVTQTSYQELTFTTNPDRSTKTLKTLDHVHEGVEVSESQNKKFSGRVQSDKDSFRGRIRRGSTENSHLYPCVLNTDGFGRYELSGNAGLFVVNVTQTSYQAEENHNITLEWTFTTKPGRYTKIHIIYCYLITVQKLPVLYHVLEGVEVSECQDAKFSGRVQSDKDALREGRIRLQLSRLRTDDSGRYVCKVNTDDGYGSASCQLNVTAALHQPYLQAPTGTPKPESKKRSWGVKLGLGLLLLVICALLYVFRKKGNSDRPSEIPLTEQLPNNVCYNSISAELENQPKDVSRSV